MRLDEVRQVIVQAGGKGSRLGHYTANKPKCLLSVDGQPLLYRLFDHLPDAEFIVVGDSSVDALEAYLEVVPPRVPVTVVRATGSGSATGLRAAVDRIGDDRAPFLVVWCDLLFEDGLPGMEVGDEPVVCLTDRSTCRWSVDGSGGLVEESSDTRGVVGLFYFPGAESLAGLPDDGEFVRFLSTRWPVVRTGMVAGVRELGTLVAVREYQEGKQVTRFFNRIEVGEREVVKSARTAEFGHLIDAEADWYERTRELGFGHAPRMLSRSPLTIERIDGTHPFDLAVDDAERDKIVTRIVECLSELHGLGSAVGDPVSCREMYRDKTVERLRRVQRIIPNLAEPTLTINDRRCRNPLHPRHEEWFHDRIDAIGIVPFAFIHGDPTFSNMLLDGQGDVRLIDPRGTFGKTVFHGDPRYDWAKLVYSVEGDYDQFNRRRFALSVDDADVRLSIESNGWKRQGVVLREGPAGHEAVDTIHALIWLSLSGYVLDDVDSILGAFYNGALHLERSDG